LNNRGKIAVSVVVLIIAVVAAVYFASPERRANVLAWRNTRQRKAVGKRRFVAVFDSLCDARLYPVVRKSGVFTRSRFEGNREKWILTISSRDWKMRNDDSKQDLVATVWTTFWGVREQAGGRPQDARLVIQNEDGET
jgi:hypothetical protein